MYGTMHLSYDKGDRLRTFATRNKQDDCVALLVSLRDEEWLGRYGRETSVQGAPGLYVTFTHEEQIDALIDGLTKAKEMLAAPVEEEVAS